MKPERTERWVKFWDCGIPGHCHVTEATAANCIAKTRMRLAKQQRNGVIRERPEQNQYRTYFFDCGVADHNHQKMTGASKCIEKRAAQNQSRRWTDTALFELLNLRRSGMTLDELGRKYGLTGSRIGYLISRAECQEQKLLHWVNGSKNESYIQSIERMPTQIRKHLIEMLSDIARRPAQ